MAVIVNDAIMATFLRSTFGPIGRDLARRANNVAEQAAANASGEILGVETGDLRAGIFARLDQDANGLVATVGSPALHRGFGYGAYWDARGRPWLSKALRDRVRDNT